MNVSVDSSSDRGNMVKASKGCGMVVLGVIALVGLVMTAAFIPVVWEKMRSRFWEATPCTILSSELTGLKSTKPTLNVTYHYTFEGKHYTGNRVALSGNTFDNLTSAQQAARRYRSDQRSTCYVNPSSPKECVLEQASLLFALILLFPLVFLGVGGVGLFRLWKAKLPTSAPLSEQHAKGASRWMLRLVGGVFTLTGVLFMHGIFARSWLVMRASADWRAVPCVITSSKVQSHSSDDGVTYSVEITYDYEVDGEKFIGTRYNFAFGTSNLRDWRDHAVKAHPRGHKTVCYVNPNDPVDAVLVREMGPDAWFALLPAVFILAGVGMLVASRKGAGQGAKNRLRTEPTPLHGLRGTIGETNGPVSLTPAASPLGKFLGVLFVAVFWNGVVLGVLLFANAPWPVKAFLSIFAVIGVGLFAAAIHQFLSLFNPKPTLQAARSAARLGETLEVGYSFSGRTRRIQRLKITLKAEEVATYRRGTDTHTDKNVFYEAVLLDTKVAGQIQPGSVSLTIPTNAMHSFSAPNNKIAWTLHLHGDIPRWPDVDLEFPLTVLPHPIAAFHEDPVRLA
jgi:hypothetical protein